MSPRRNWPAWDWLDCNRYPMPRAIRCRGNWDPGEFGAIGIPLGGGGRLVVQLNWSYQPGVSDLAARILCHLLATGQYPEPIPPGPREF